MNPPAATVLGVATVAAAAGCSASDSGTPDASLAHGQTHVVFQRHDADTGKVRLYVVRQDGSGLRAITLPGGGEGRDTMADWSPDGRRIVFRRVFNPGEANERTEVLVVAPDGTQLRNLTRASCTGDCLSSGEPAWSADGRHIAFVRTIGPRSPRGLPSIVGLFVMDADGSDLLQLTQLEANSGTEDHAPAWSPDGRRIAFMRWNTTATPHESSAIYTVGADGSNLRLVRRMPRRWPGAGAPEWAPDGKTLLFSTYCYFGDRGQPPTGAQLFTVKPDGTALRRLTAFAGNSYNPEWSSDGRRIVFVRNARVGPVGHVYTMNSDGTEVRRVTSRPQLHADQPDWGP